MTINQADGLYLGSIRADAAYMGTVKVWPAGSAWPDGPTVDLLAAMKAASANGTFEFTPPLRFAEMTAVWEGDELVLRWPAGRAANFLGTMWAAYFPSNEASIPHPDPTMNVDGALGWVQKWESTGTLPLGTGETDCVIIAWGSAPPEEQYPERGTLYVYPDDGLSGEKAYLFTEFYFDDPAYVSNKGNPGPAFWYLFGTLPAGVDVPAGEWRLTKAEWTAFFTPGPDATGTPLEWTFDTDAAGWFDVNDPPDFLDPVTTPGTPAGWADGHAIVQAVDQGGTDLAGFLWYTPEPIHLKAGTYHIVAEIQRAPGFNYGTGPMRGATWWMTGYAGATMEGALEPALALESVPGGADGWMYNIVPENTDLIILNTSTLPPTTDSTGPSTITIPSDGDWFFGFTVQLMTLFAGAGAATGELWLHRVAVLDEAGNVVRI